MAECRVAAELRGIVKVYPDGVRALDGVDFRLCEGEVHALLGENGAGKTTLMRILYGEIKPTRGEVYIGGVRVRLGGTIDAIRMGVSMVYQHPRMVPTLTVRDNMELYFKSAGIPRGEAWERLKWAEGVTGFKVPLDERVMDLPLGVLQRAEILRSLAAGARILILDEPTTNLTPLEVEGLFQAVENMKREGIAVAYITHRLPEVERVADKVTVLRKGRVAARELDPRRVGVEELAKLMVGEVPPPARRDPRPRGRGGVVLEVRGLRVRGRVEVRIDGLQVESGEILGVAGVEGNGQDELVAAVVGLLKPLEGEVRVLGMVNPGVREFLSAGGAFIPGDRGKALIHSFSAAENVAFLLYAHGGPFLLTPGRLSRLYSRVAGEYRVVGGPWTPVSSLSGGNQQKLLVGSQLSLRPRLLVAVNPTRGLDVATTRYVRSLIARMAGSGAGVLLVSSDLDEILELSDRIAVMYKGKITGILERAEATPERLGALMGGAS